MNLADISQEAFGFDVAEFPMGLDDGVEASASEPMSPNRSRLVGSAHKRTRSNGASTGAQPSLLFQQSQTMRDLESLILAFDALENFALIWEKLDKYVTLFLSLNECLLTWLGTDGDGILERPGPFWRNCRSHWMKSEYMWMLYLTNG